MTRVMKLLTLEALHLPLYRTQRPTSKKQAQAKHDTSYHRGQFRGSGWFRTNKIDVPKYTCGV